MPPKKILPPPPQNKGSHLHPGERDIATPPPSSPALPTMASSTIRSRSNSYTSDDYLALTPSAKRGRIIGDSSDTSESDQGPAKKTNKDIIKTIGKEEEEKLRYDVVFCKSLTF